MNTNAIPLPPGTESIYAVTCKDVVMGRGSGTQNHCGNVTYRKLVFLNKELYATSCKFDKLKISKAIVAAVRAFGGRFLQSDDKRDGMHFDIGDKRAWDKTSQALREGQSEVRARLAEEEARLWEEHKKASGSSGEAVPFVSKVQQYRQIISDEAFFSYSMMLLESLHQPTKNADAPAPSNQPLLAPVREHALAPQSPETLPHRAHSSPPDLTLRSPTTGGREFPHNFASPDSDCPPSRYGVSHGPKFLNSKRRVTLRAYNPESQQIMRTLRPSPESLASPRALDMEPIPYESGEYPPSQGMHETPVASSVIIDPTDPSTQPPAPENVESFEPLPYGSERPKLQRHSSVSSLFHLRSILGAEDFDMSSEEERISMQSDLSQEVETLIRNSSRALNYIDEILAHEDLVFEEDSMEIKQPAAPINSAEKKRPESAEDEDEASLMNMSILSLGESTCKSMHEKDRRMGGFPIRKTILQNYEEGMPTVVGNRSSHIKFDENISVMTMDDGGSFRQMVKALPEFDDTEDSRHSAATGEGVQCRNSGFQYRRSTASQSYSSSFPTVIKRREEQPRVSDMSLSVISSYCAEPAGENDQFKDLAGRVTRPLSSASLTFENMSTLGDDYDEG